MSDTASTPTDPDAANREQATAAVLPVLTSLDQQASALQRAGEKGEQINQGSVVSYELAAQHAKHLIGAGGLSADDIKDAAAEHGGSAARRTAERALDHASHTRSFEATPPPETAQDKDIDDEVEIDL
ncbi:hypothetical protein ACFY12_34270 [Streptomyces sp. NPDC001339]|uniref:hypothetical protein n=1 Tax=Streptomyces sp. NPDC001339 TaxID=3364563 RepID=UPI0036BD4AD6